MVSDDCALHPLKITIDTTKTATMVANLRTREREGPIGEPLTVLVFTLLLLDPTEGGDVKDNNVKIFIAELIGTMVLVLGGCGTAVLATGAFPTDGDGALNVGILGVSFAFGLSVLVMAYAIGSISGCHINPAVTLGLVLAKKTKVSMLPIYWVAQVAGGILGALFIKIIASGVKDWNIDDSSFATNGYGELSPGGFSLGAVAVTEILFTALFVLVVILAIRKGAPAGFAGIAIGLMITLVHLVTIPVSNTSVNPARSAGVALIKGGDALTSQLWAFWVFPLIGAVLAGLIAMYLLPEDKKAVAESE
jgi:aquaporin Z